jgi:hypothetical protein
MYKNALIILQIVVLIALITGCAMESLAGKNPADNKPTITKITGVRSIDNKLNITLSGRLSTAPAQPFVLEVTNEKKATTDTVLASRLVPFNPSNQVTTGTQKYLAKKAEILSNNGNVMTNEAAKQLAIEKQKILGE